MAVDAGEVRGDRYAYLMLLTMTAAIMFMVTLTKG